MQSDISIYPTYYEKPFNNLTIPSSNGVRGKLIPAEETVYFHNDS